MNVDFQRHERSANPAVASGRASRISWQAALLNFFTRHFIKNRITRGGSSPQKVRRFVRLLEMLTISFHKPAPVRQVLVAGVPCDVVYPLAPPAEERTILYLHGGGFFLHLPKAYRRFARRIADTHGATVYIPDYRLAPEHRHPAAVDDCLAIYRALLDDGLDPRRLGLMGDSAGGNLALVTLQRARDEGLPLPACATVLSAGADMTLSGESYRRNAKADPLIPVSALPQLVTQYVGDASKAHPHASPMLGDFTGLPPIKLVVGSTEVLLDDSITTAERCRAAGVEVDLDIWERMPHGFPVMDFLPEGRLAMGDMADFFEKHTRPTRA